MKFSLSFLSLILLRLSYSFPKNPFNSLIKHDFKSALHSTTKDDQHTIDLIKTLEFNMNSKLEKYEKDIKLLKNRIRILEEDKLRPFIEYDNGALYTEHLYIDSLMDLLELFIPRSVLLSEFMLRSNAVRALEKEEDNGAALTLAMQAGTHNNIDKIYKFIVDNKGDQKLLHYLLKDEQYTNDQLSLFAHIHTTSTAETARITGIRKFHHDYIVANEEDNDTLHDLLSFGLLNYEEQYKQVTSNNSILLMLYTACIPAVTPKRLIDLGCRGRIETDLPSIHIGQPCVEKECIYDIAQELIQYLRILENTMRIIMLPAKIIHIRKSGTIFIPWQIKDSGAIGGGYTHTVLTEGDVKIHVKAY